MAKVMITADTLMTIIKEVFSDNDLNTVVDTGREEWKNKKLFDILNVDYYTHKHTVKSTEDIQNELMAQGVEEIDGLAVLKRSFCLVSLEEMQRLWSKDIDQIAVKGTLQFWLQAEKLKLLEAFIEAVNIALCGEKLTIELQGERRRATLFFGSVNSNVEGQTEIGESAIATISVDMMITPNIVCYSDYGIKFLAPKENDKNELEFQSLPVTNIQLGDMMTGKAIPFSKDSRRSSQINLSNSMVVTLTFEGNADSPVVKMFVKDKLSRAATNISDDDKPDNNKIYPMKLTRLSDDYVYDMKVQDHKISVNNDTGVEINTLSLTTGENYGAT